MTDRAPPVVPKPGSSMARVLDAADEANLKIEIRTMDQSTRTAEDAAKACGCQVAQIVKSLVFAEDDDLVLLLVSGANQVDTNYLRDHFGLELSRADPREVRQRTGFAIGGVAPLGHLRPIRIFMDQRLLDFAEVWAAAGRPDSVFRVSPSALEKAINPKVIPVRA